MEYDNNSHSSRNRSILDVLLWPTLILFLLLSLLAALHWYLRLDLEDFSISAFSRLDLLAAFLFHMLALGTVILSWHWNLLLHGVQGIYIRHSLVMVGFSTVGKYTPGKIWGMVARGLVLYRLTGRNDRIIQSTLTEQLALMHSGLWIAAICASLVLMQPLLTILIVIFGLVAVFWVANGGKIIRVLIQTLDRKHQLADKISISGLRKSYPSVFLSLCLMWGLASASLWFCIHAYDGATVPPFSQVALISILSFLGSFAAFFAPAGLGVREGIVAGMLAPHVGLAPALYISLLHRLITAALDVLLGLLSLLLSKGTTQANRTHD